MASETSSANDEPVTDLWVSLFLHALDRFRGSQIASRVVLNALHLRRAAAAPFLSRVSGKGVIAETARREKQCKMG
jgi:hypothetical protein